MGHRISGNLTFYTRTLLGVGAAIVLILFGIWVQGEMIIRQIVGEGSTTVLVPMILAIAVLIGNQVCRTGQDKRDINIILTMTAMLTILLLTVGLLLEGKFHNIGYNLLAITLGCGVSCVICLKKPRSRTKKKRSYR